MQVLRLLGPAACNIARHGVAALPATACYANMKMQRCTWCCLQGIDAVIASIHTMVSQIDTLDFAIFDKALASQWQAAKSSFMESDERIKDATRELIDTSFRSK